ncbi:MAG: Trk system potassium transporter TrkA [Bradymonadales bacterium]|nr:Trk system potassium transporter TrkA [Bradymonadales bacterium]
MKILIVGAGVVGESLADQLSSEGHQVAVIDQDRRKVQELEDKLDVLAVRGNAGMPSVLKSAGIQNTDMVIAVTDVDEINLVVGMFAARMGVTHRIVRIRNREYTGADSVLPLKDLGIDHVINPEPTIVNALTRMIEIPGAIDFGALAGGQVLLLGFLITADSPAAGRSMAELRKVGEADGFLVLNIHRGEKVIVPKGSDTVEPGDKVHLVVSTETLPFLLPLIHRTVDPIKQVIIAGGSRIGVTLAEAIEPKVDRVFLIEPDSEQAEEIAERLERTIVLQGDATDLDLLKEASLERCDLFCAVSDDDQLNMLAALLAKKHSKTRAAVLVHQPEYLAVMQSLGVEIIVNPRLVTVGEILMHVRRGHIHSVTRLADSLAEIIEMEATEGSPALRAKLRDLHFPANALVGAIVREGSLMIPDGNTQIAAGDTVLVYALPDAIPRVEKLFARRRFFGP